MPENKARLQKIDRWVRRFAWYYLIGFILAMIAIAINIIVVLINQPESIILFGENNNTWVNLVTVFANANRISAYLFIYLFLQGISKTIHYLLALKENLREKYKSGLFS